MIWRPSPANLSQRSYFDLDSLVTPTAHGIASRVLACTAGGNITLLAFDTGEELSEHTLPFDALLVTLSSGLTLTMWDTDTDAPHTVVLMPAYVPHDARADEPSAPCCSCCATGVVSGAKYSAYVRVSDSSASLQDRRRAADVD